MSLFILFRRFWTFSPPFPIAFAMSPAFTTNKRRSVVSTQSTTVVLVRSWNRRTYWIVSSVNVISAMPHLGGQDVRVSGVDDRERGHGERLSARGAQLRVCPLEREGLRAEGRKIFRAVRRDDDEAGLPRPCGQTNLPRPEPNLARVHRDLEGAGDIDH